VKAGLDCEEKKQQDKMQYIKRALRRPVAIWWFEYGAYVAK